MGQPPPAPSPDAVNSARPPADEITFTISGSGEEVKVSTIRFVRFRFGWGYQDTCPAIVFDGEYVAVLIPPLAHPIASCRFAFRAPPGGWSYVEAHSGSGIGEYQEV